MGREKKVESRNDTHTVLKRFQNFRYGLILQGVIVGAAAGLVSVLFRLAVERAGDFLEFMLDAGTRQVIFKVIWFAALAVLSVVVARLVK